LCFGKLRDIIVMVECTATVQNHAGIHCRPSSEILLAVQQFPNCTFALEVKGERVELNSMLSLLGLGLVEGDEIKVFADGDNEQVACDTVAKLFEFHFDFPTET
jgi:phosphotransferase system HPr (HPr) family protein